MKTYTPTPKDIERRWYVIDARDAVLGRLATQVASILRGKHKPIFAPHADTGDHVIVVNAAAVRLTGGKEEKKLEYRHSGYPGGLRATGYGRLLAEQPAHVVEKAVRGMLPKNRLGRAMVHKLKVYAGPEHPHEGQRPVALPLGETPKWEGLPAPKPAPEAKPKERPAKRATAKRASARPTAKRATSKPSAKASTAKRGTAKRTTAKASTAKRPTAKRSSAREKSETKAPRRRRAKKEE